MDPRAITIPTFPPEYVNASNASRIVGVVGFFHVVAFIFVSLRTYVRLVLVRAFGVDDALIILTVLLAMGSWICLILQIPYGLGRHGLTISIENRTSFERIGFWKTVWSDGVALGLLRISMAISLLRLKKDLIWYRWSLFAVMGFVVAYSIQAIAWLFVYCTPYSGWWEFQWMNPFDPRCHNFTVFVNLTYWNIACNIFTDVCLGMLPVPIIWNLQMKLRVRLYVIGILNLGYFAVLMGILKAVFMLLTGGDPDNTFDYWVHFWQNLQLNIGIVAACASFLKPLVGRFLKINSSAGYYPSGSNNQYIRGGRNQQDGSNPISSNSYAKNKGRTGLTDQSLHDIDGFELRSKSENEIRVVEQQTSRAPSDTNSEEIILQKPGPAGQHGIMYTRDFSVKYSNK